MREFISSSWNGIMDHNLNPLRHIPDLQVRHMVMQILAFMWSTIFAVLIVDSMWVFGISAVAHILFIAGIVITVVIFKTAETNPNAFKFINGYHSPGRSRSQWIDGKRYDLPKGDPGGEHE